MNAAERTYRLLLRVYPADFHAAYEREMLLAFRAQRRDARQRGASLWAATFFDIARSASVLHLEALRMQRGMVTQTGEGTFMKMTMGILAVLVGALETMNAFQEVWGAGVVNHDSRSLLAGTIAMVAGVLIIAAGTGLLRSSPNARSLARGAAITSLVVFACLGVFVPLLSMFAIVLGTVFPIALLAFAHWDRPRGMAAPIVA